jgi:hypothetical protein
MVLAFHEAGDGPFQLRQAVETAATDRLLADQAESAFHQIEPRGTGGRGAEIERGCAASH